MKDEGCLVPTLRVGTEENAAPRRADAVAMSQEPAIYHARAAERPRLRSHAERGNEGQSPLSPLPSPFFLLPSSLFLLPSSLLLQVAAAVGGVAMWLLLPRSGNHARALGLALGAVSLGLTAAALPGLADWISQSSFWILAGVTIVSAAFAVTFRNPVYCAIWFGMSLLGTSGLFFFQGAQFLAVATVVVYAGAILVVFLFILMLASPSGRARYDRVSWEGLLSAACAAFLVGILSVATTGALASPEPGSPAAKITQADRQRRILADEHVKQLGGPLFGRYLAAVEVAGVLLLAALVGAAVIVGHARGPLVEPERQASEHAGGPPDA